MTPIERARRGIAVAPRAAAARSALEVMREGGNAIEAMVAAAATIAVVYPHMNSIGGDAFWLIPVPGHPPRAIDARGAAAARHRRGRARGGRARDGFLPRGRSDDDPVPRRRRRQYGCRHDRRMAA